MTLKLLPDNKLVLISPATKINLLCNVHIILYNFHCSKHIELCQETCNFSSLSKFSLGATNMKNHKKSKKNYKEFNVNGNQ